MTVVISGNSGIVNVQGSASNPAESATGGSNTGLYFPSTTSVALSTNGVAALTITSGQLVGIGTSSPGYLLTVNGTASFVNQLAANNSPNVNSQGAWIGWNASGVTGETNFINQNGAGVGGFTWAQSTTGNSRTEWMRLTSSGALGINTTSVQGKFQVNQDTTVSAFNSVFRTLSSGSFLYDLIVGGDSTGPYIGPYQSYPLRFNTNNTEVMRLGTNGWLGVGTSSPIRQFHLNTGASSAIEMSLTTTSSSGTAYLDISDNAGNNGGNYNLYFRGLTSSGATQVNLNTIYLYANTSYFNGLINATGNITAYYSDKRLKNIAGTIQDALNKVATLSGVVYKNNDVAAKYGYTSQEEQVGVIAQEVQEVLPQVVKPAPFDTNGDGTSKSGENYTTVQYEKLVPLLIEAIKELKREVDVLKSAKFCQCP